MSVNLPIVDGVKSPEMLLDSLDEEQREVATCLGVPLVVIAGAGSGKTRAITHRIAYACASGTQNPRAVLAVTFTTRAAGEMKSRLNVLGVRHVQARTFHSAALRQARYFWPRVHGVELPEVQSSTLSFVAEAARRSKLNADITMLRDLASEISWAKACNVSASQYAQLALTAHRTLSVELETMGTIFADYEFAKRRAGVIDFDDILLCTVALLAGNPEVADQIRASYRHLVVDEFQDVSPLQRTLLGLWLGDSDDICVVGDPHQAIHGFAGGDREFLLRFARDFPRAQTITLNRNYRSTPQILRLANQVSSGVNLRAMRPDGMDVTKVSCSTQRDEAAKTAEWLSHQHRQGRTWGQLAVLYRVNAQAPVLEAALSEKKIPYVVKGAERFWERAEVVNALHALRQTQPSEDMPAREVVREVLGDLGWQAEPPTGAGRVRERWESWQALIELADDLIVHNEGQTFTQVVAAMNERAALEHVPTADAVTLSTMHASKGLEWEAVSIIGLQEGMMPFSLAVAGNQIDEEQRLLHVALTRARDELRVSWSWSGKNVDGRRGPSRFLASALGSLKASSHRPIRTTTTKKSAKCRVCRRSLTSGAEIKMGRHFDCPAQIDIDVLDRLKEWRLAIAKEQSVPAYVIFTDATLIAVAEARPVDEEGLSAIKGIGARKIERYGAQVLKLLAGEEVADVLKSDQ